MTWQRLEGSGVSADLTAGLQARLADPLWMLARQWQVGEFTGEDAASPVLVSASVAYEPIGEVRVGGGPVERLDPEGVPLETRVECEDVHRGPARLRLAAELGHQLLRLIEDPDLVNRLRGAYPLRLPNDDGADPRGRLELELLAARGFDGEALAADLRRGEPADPAIAAVASRWLAMVSGFITTPPVQRANGWHAERLEYALEVAAPSFDGGTRLTADGYAGGHLDWHAFNVAGTGNGTGPGAKAATIEVTTVPVPLHYPGMPARRWWEFEDRDVYWGDVQGGPQDLPRYLVAAYGAVAGDDWYQIPVDLPRGVLAQVQGVQVADSFGASHPVPAAAVLDHRRYGAARPWRYFELTGDPAPAAGRAPRLLLPAVLAPHDTGTPVEEVLFLRDEVANLAWAVERYIEGASGHRVPRNREPLPPPVESTGTAWGYKLATPVPANFIPLVPVRLDDASAAMRLQRGRMATSSGTADGARGLILEPQRRLLLHEEEIPRTGLRVTRAYELCRSPDGGVHLWAARRKRPGRDPASPGLRHDVVTPSRLSEVDGVEES